MLGGDAPGDSIVRRFAWPWCGRLEHLPARSELRFPRGLGRIRRIFCAFLGGPISKTSSRKPASAPSSGTATFVFCDVEDSAKLLREVGDERYAELLAGQHDLLRETFEAAGGIESERHGDAFFGVFGRRGMQWRRWPRRSERSPVTTGPAAPRSGCAWACTPARASSSTATTWHWRYEAARVSAAGHGGQVLLSGATVLHVDGVVPEGLRLVHLGEHRLEGLEMPERLFQLVVEGLPES